MRTSVLCPPTAALDSPAEDIRQEAARYLVRGYAADPMPLNASVRSAVVADRTEAGSNREDFARELLRRMLGKEPSNTERWLMWLWSEEADHPLPNENAGSRRPNSSCANRGAVEHSRSAPLFGVSGGL
jgi:hypothetical protein